MRKNIRVIIFFSILLLTALCYGLYTSIMFVKTDNLYKEMSFKYEKVSAYSKNYITVTDFSNKSYTYMYNLYAYNYPTEVVGFDGDLYQIEATGDALRNCIDDLVETNKVIFQNDIYKCDSRLGKTKTKEPFIKKLNMKEKDIHKVVISNHPGNALDTSYVTFFILESGEVKCALNSGDIKNIEEFKNIKIKDIKHFYCKYGSYDTCKGGYKIDAITKDDKNIIVDIKKSEF